MRVNIAAVFCFVKKIVSVQR